MRRRAKGERREKKKYRTGVPLKVRLFGIRTKLIGAFLIPVLLILVLGVLSTQKASGAIAESYKENVLNTVRKTGEYYDLLFQMLDAKSTEIANDNDLRNYYGGVYSGDPAAESDAYNKAAGKVRAAAQSDGNVGSACIMASYGRTIASTGLIDAESYDEYISSEEGKAVLDLNGEASWSGYHEFVDNQLNQKPGGYAIAVSRQITGNNLKPVGVVVIDAGMDAVSSILATIELPQGSRCALITPDGREITAQGESGESFFPGTDFYKEAAGSGEQKGLKELEYGGEQYLYVYSRVDTSGSVINALVPLAQVTGQADAIRKLTYQVTVLAIIIAILVGMILALDIGNVIGKMNHMVEKAADGDLTVKIKSRRKDEFSLLSRHLDEMFGNTKKLIHKSADVAGNIAEASVNVADLSGGLVETSRGISEVIGQMEKGLSLQAEDAKKCLDKMGDLEQKIETVHTETEQIAEFSENTKQVVREGMKSVGELDEKSKETNRITRNVIENIEKLENESNAIEGIVSTINSIAKKTNMLSLNASIEAARAGASGRGFAVVADQIRELAAGSMESSGQIQQIIEGIRRTTENTVEAARQAETTVVEQGQTIEGVVDAFERIRERVRGLTGNIGEITDGIGDIQEAKDVTLKAVENITAVLEQTAATAEQVQASSGRQVQVSEKLNAEAVKLKGQSVELQDSICRFTVE